MFYRFTDQLFFSCRDAESKPLVWFEPFLAFLSCSLFVNCIQYTSSGENSYVKQRYCLIGLGFNKELQQPMASNCLTDEGTIDQHFTI